MKLRIVTLAIGVLSSCVLPAVAAVDRAKVDELSASIEPKVIAWRRDIHQYPELAEQGTNAERDEEHPAARNVQHPSADKSNRTGTP